MKTLLIIISLTVTAFAELPNILWITSEDNAAHWLGCYGNKQASTPRLDKLAAEGIRFTRAYSNAPVCAVARSTILNGSYAISMGTQHMRSRHPIPASFRSYVSHLREIGYYCTNNSKTDYNFKGNDAAIWDECSGKAHYRKRPKDKPFMAVFNLTISHESNLFPQQVARNRKQGIIPETPRIAPADITLPPSQPDLPEMRSDAAIYHDCITAMDRQVGKLLDELDEQGLADNSIVFYYSDHGGAMARGKRYLEDSGVRIPMIVHLPKKWRHLSPFAPGSTVDEPVAFVDLAPTVLSFADQATPASMQGRAFLGKHRAGPREFEILFGDRFDENPGMRRAITDGDFKYIRCFSPNQPGAPYSSYALGQPSWKAWKDAAAEGKLKGYHLQLWQAPQPVEQLFDLRSDPWEIHNLATKPELAQRLIAMRGKLREIMINTRDTSLVPEEMWKEVAVNGTIHHYVAEAGKDHAAWVDLAFMATSGSITPALDAAFESTSPVARYWAASACLFHPGKAANLAGKLGKLAEDSSPVVRRRATEALSAIQN